VETVLEQVGAAEVPFIRVYNKVDKAVTPFNPDLGGADDAGLAVSASTGMGLQALTEAVRVRLMGGRVTGHLTLGPEQSRLRAKLFDWRAVRHETEEPDGGWTLEVELTAQRWHELQTTEGLPQSSIRQKV
jgi:GTP-binding protein HflX